MGLLPPEIAAHYDEGAERDRLTGGGRLEYLRTRELLARWLPPAPADILDVGGAAGVYALPLASEGYRVRLVDPVPLHVQQAREGSAAQPHSPLIAADLGGARALDVADQSADAVLLLGPLYHLIERDDRVAALVEAARVVRPGGVVAAAAVSRFASMLDGLFRGRLDEPGFEAVVEGALHDGIHRNPDAVEGWFTTAYFHLPEELGPELADAALRVEAVLPVEGPAWLLPDLQARLDDPDRREQLLRAIRRTEREPSFAGATSHLLAVGRRP